jgi:hypothetical protein
MDRRQSIIANVEYISAKPRGPGQLKGITAKRVLKRLSGGGTATGSGRVKGLARYVQYRDDRSGHITQIEGLQRWTDRGLGRDFQTVAARCEQLKSEHVQAFTWVISPHPDLMHFVQPERQEQVVRELTEQILDDYFDRRGIAPPECAYALHRRDTTDDQQPGRLHLHTHVFLAGTYDSWLDGQRLPLYMNRGDQHIDLLHQVAEAQLDQILQREVGLDWEQRYDALLAERDRQTALSNQPEPEQAPDLPTLSPDTASTTSLDIEPPHTVVCDQAGQHWNVWIGTHAIDEEVLDVGYIVAPADDPLDQRRQFEALIRQLPTAQAEQIAQTMLDFIQENPEEGLFQAIDWAKQLQRELLHPEPPMPSLDEPERQSWADLSL